MNMEKTWAWDTQKGAFRSLTSAINALADMSAEMPVQQMQVLCWIALNEGKTQRELRAGLVNKDGEPMSSSTASRNIQALSKVHRLGKDGLNLVEYHEDPLDRRAKQLWLTPRGRAFVTRLAGLL